MKRRERAKGRRRSRFRGDLWILLIMGFLLLWVVLAHELGSYGKTDRDLGRLGARNMWGDGGLGGSGESFLFLPYLPSPLSP